MCESPTRHAPALPVDAVLELEKVASTNSFSFPLRLTAADVVLMVHASLRLSDVQGIAKLEVSKDSVFGYISGFNTAKDEVVPFATIRSGLGLRGEWFESPYSLSTRSMWNGLAWF